MRIVGLRDVCLGFIQNTSRDVCVLGAITGVIAADFIGSNALLKAIGFNTHLRPWDAFVFGASAVVMESALTPLKVTLPSRCARVAFSCIRFVSTTALVWGLMKLEKENESSSMTFPCALLLNSVGAVSLFGLVALSKRLQSAYLRRQLIAQNQPPIEEVPADAFFS